MTFVVFDGGVHGIGASGKHGRPDTGSFCFDNELPRHRVVLEPYALADRLVTNGEYLEFIRDGGYRHATLWLSDGWQAVTQHGWNRPLYWSESLDVEFTLNGMRDLDAAAPVSHLSYYEADAFARWTGERLPTEAEWELAAVRQPVQGNLLDAGALHPLPVTVPRRSDLRVRPHAVSPPSSQPALRSDPKRLHQLFGDTWEWTASPYVAYPGYRGTSGALGEYNGKFMCNQWVLRGGSCATPGEHIRASYRNFFYPDTRWQFAGLRLARGA
jgi:ergothioneine biosynthesis protein EgtB